MSMSLTCFDSVKWLHYLAVQLLHAFNIRRPVASKRSISSKERGYFTERDCWACLQEVEAALARSIDDALGGVGLKGRNRKPSAKAQDLITSTIIHPTQSLASASAVLGWGRTCGWLG
jgi:serine/threonine-protein kinase haspin